jgi:long-chain acyl-CoA synthetase
MIDWWGPILCEYYGASEGGGITLMSSEDWDAHKGSVGKPVVGEFHVVGEDGEELPVGESGVVYFEGGLPIDYHNDPDKTASAYDHHAWNTVGDMGYLDEDGFLYLTDRKDHMIISGGVNIYPQEIEAVLIRHPAVADVAVIGVPNAEFGEEVRAVVQPLDPGAAGPELAEELVAFCRGELAGYKCPRQVDFENELPRAPSGKLYKRRVRARYWEGHGTAIG